MQQVDLLITNALIVTVDTHLSVIENGYVAVKVGKIIAIAEMETSISFQAVKTIDASGMLIVPGLVNTHTHTGNTIYRGFADDMYLQEWLKNYIFPLEAKFCSEETVRLSAQLSIIEMIRSGTTTFSDMYYYEHEVAKVVDEVGVRAHLAETILDFPGPNSKTSSEGLKYTEELLQNWSNHPLIKVGVAPHAPYTCNGDTLKKAKELADKYGALFHLHLSETKTEVENCLKEHQFTPTQYLDELGVWNQNSFAVHCVHLNEKDKEVLISQKVAISHNPQSNMKLASGAAPIQDMLNKGALVAIGTDGTASNNNLNMFEEMDMAAKLQKLSTNDPTSLDAKTVFQLGTIKGAELLQWNQEIGSLEVGKKADMILIDINQPQLTPMYNPYSHLIYAMNGSEVQTVIINGRIVMENRKLTTIDEEEVLDKVKFLAKKIAKEF